MSNTGVYDPASWKKLKFSKLLVSLSGSSWYHPRFPLHCFTPLTNSKQADCVMHFELSFARSLLKAATGQKQ
jgi:hypothetical protein